MNYEAKKWDVVDIAIKADGSADFVVRVISHPVGDTYGFDRGDNTTVNVAGYGTKTGDVINTEIQAAVNAFVAATYPNT